VIAYSCDTEPTAAVLRLAAGADILLHESSGGGVGHSSPDQAGQIAQQAEVARLLLIHYPTIDMDEEFWLRQARSTYHGQVELARDFQELEI
jgi:ribonuclease Z